MNFKDKKYIFPILALCLISVSGCKNSNKDVKQITIGTTSQIEKAQRDEYAYDMLASGVSEMPLVSKNEKGEYSPLVASYSSNDSKTWTYTIKENLYWSDGEKVTAEDIVYSLEYESTSENPAFSSKDIVGTYENYSYSDDKNSVTLTLTNANVKSLDDMTTFRIRPKHIYENKTKEQITESDSRVTCGPYKLESFNKEAGALTFTINEYYPQKPHFDKVIYKLFNNEEIMYSSLLNEQLDFVWNYSMGVSSTYQNVLGNSNKVKLSSIAATNCPAMLVFNNKNGLLSDKNIRFAISYALDYEQFKEYFGSKYASTPNRSFAPTTLVGFKETEQLKTNYDKASEYMIRAGYTKDDKYWVKDGISAEFKLTVNASKEMHVGYAEFVKTQLEKFGIKVNLDIVDATTYNAKTSNKFASEQGSTVSMEAAIMGYTAFGMKNLGDMYINGNHQTQGGAQVFDDSLNEIINSLNNAKTLEEYINYAGQLQDFYAQETPAIALYWDSLIVAYSASLTDITLDSTFGINNINNWFSMKK